MSDLDFGDEYGALQEETENEKYLRDFFERNAERRAANPDQQPLPPAGGEVLPQAPARKTIEIGGFDGTLRDVLENVRSENEAVGSVAGVVARDAKSGLLTGDYMMQGAVAGPMEFASSAFQMVDDFNVWADQFQQTDFARRLGAVSEAPSTEPTLAGSIADWIESKTPEPARTLGGEMARSTTEFMSAMLPVMGQLSKLRQGLGISGQIAEHIVQPNIAGAIAGFVTVDQTEEDLNAFLKTHPKLKDPVMDYLNSPAPDARMEARLKSALSEAVFGMAVDGGFIMLKAFRNARLASRRGEPQRIKDLPMSNAELLLKKRLFTEQELALGDPGAPRLTVEEKSFNAIDKAMRRLERDFPDMDPQELQMRAAAEATVVDINLARIDTEEDIAELMQEVTDITLSAVNRARRGTRSNRKTLAEAERLGVTPEALLSRRTGTALNAEQAVAARRIWVASAESLMGFAEKAAAPNAGILDQFKFRKALAVFSAINNQVLGMRAEAGRALQSFNIPASAGDIERTRIAMTMMQQFGEAEVSQALAIRMRDLLASDMSPGAINQVARLGFGARTMAAVKEAFVNGLLWSPKTHLVNFASNAILSTHALMIRQLAVKTRQAMGSVTGDNVMPGEAWAMLMGDLAGIRTSLSVTGQHKNARQEILGLIPGGTSGKFNVDSSSRMRGQAPRQAISTDNFNIQNSPGAAFLNFMGHLTRTPGSLLQAGDSLFKIVGYSGELYAQAWRMASKRGGTPDEIMTAFKEILDNPPQSIRLEAADAALYQTLTRAPSEGTSHLIRFRDWGTYNPSFLLVPFMRVVDNIVRYSLENSPLAPIVPAWRDAVFRGTGAEKDIALARLGAGTAAAMLFMDLAWSGTITGDGPSDMDRREALRRTGWQPNSVKIGNRWYSYNRLDPMGMQLGIAAKMGEVFKTRDIDDPDSMEQASEVLAAFVLAAAETGLDKTYLTGLSNFVMAMQDSDRYGAAFVQKTLQSALPMSTLLRTGVQATDVTRPEVLSIYEGVLAMIPELEKSLPRRLDLWGFPIQDDAVHGTLFDVLSPVRVTEEQGFPIDHEMVRLKLGIPRVPKIVEFPGGVSVNLRSFPRVYELYAELAGNRLPIKGKTLIENLNDMVQGKGRAGRRYLSERMTDGPEGNRADMIKAAVSVYRQAARVELERGEIPDVDGLDAFRQFVADERERIKTLKVGPR